ncbi:MAG: ThiF family adenylyltransferase [Myxococcaceae bacterium]|nr:ThiF family adenylyltransferase [Myxococcaceae bacterium]
MLTEDQIQRYSRQILLKEVGGRGQQRLSAACVEVVGASRVLDVAVAYLAASGTPVVEDTQRRGGFLHGATLQAFAPDAVLHRSAPVGWLGPLELAPASHDRFRVAVSARGLLAAPTGEPLPDAGLLPPTEADPVALGALAAPTGGPLPDAGLLPPTEADPVALGALAALVAQRYALGLERSALAVGQVEGRWQRLA